jgi:hypothetical protein
MVMVWLFFTLMLFVAEPFLLHRRLRERARTGPEATFRAVERFHWLLLALSQRARSMLPCCQWSGLCRSPHLGCCGYIFPEIPQALHAVLRRIASYDRGIARVSIPPVVS